MFQRTTAINKILNLNKFVKGIQGGTSAGKTYGVLPVEIDYCIKNPMTETSVVAESVPHLKRGALKDFKKIMKDTNRWDERRWLRTDSKYTFSNGSYMEFFGADDHSKQRGARRDRLYMNEANNMTFQTYTELASRTKQSVTLDWNPTNSFWFHEHLINDSDVDFIILTYKDNEACPESAINFINKAKEKAKTSSYWDNWYKVYGLGQLGNLEGVIFTNWNQIDTIPLNARLLGAGMDFGYTNDPTTLIAAYKYNDMLIFDEVIYQKGLMNNDIYKLSKDVRCMIYADSAEPKSINELRRYGLNIKGVDKGRDSVNFGISLLHQNDFYVTSRSSNLIKELRNYSWDTDREGNTLNKPIDAFNHAIDAIRYFAMMTMSNKLNHVKITI